MRERSSLGIEHFWEGSWVDAFCSSALFVSDTVTSTSRTFWTSWTSWTCPNHAEERLLDSEFRCEDFLWFRRYNSFFSSLEIRSSISRIRSSGKRFLCCLGYLRFFTATLPFIPILITPIFAMDECGNHPPVKMGTRLFPQKKHLHSGSARDG